MSKTILLRGPFVTSSGYGIHARQIARWIFNNHSDSNIFTELLPWGNTPWELDKTAHNNLIGKILETAKEINVPIDVSFQCQLPNEWDVNKAKFNIGITAGIETDRCNPTWVEACNKMNMVIVPSEHAKKSIISVGKVNTPIHVIPESFPDECLNTDLSISNQYKFNTDFNFLVFGQLTGNNPENDRKNIFYTLKWLCESFQDNPNVGIVIKTNAGRNSKFDKKHVVQILTNLISSIRKGPYPKIHLLHGYMSSQQVVDLYKDPTIKALVTLTRGEGYGLPILEAAACDLPIIAPAWSGYMDFMSLGKFIKVNYVLNKIHESRVDNQLFMQDAVWCNVSENDFKQRIKKFYTSSNVPKEWAVELGKKIRANYSHEAISKIYSDKLGIIL